MLPTHQLTMTFNYRLFSTPGAQLVSDSSLGGDVWVVDWTTEINVTFKIGVNLLVSTLPM